MLRTAWHKKKSDHNLNEPAFQSVSFLPADSMCLIYVYPMKTVLRWFTDCYVILLLCHFMKWVFLYLSFLSLNIHRAQDSRGRRWTILSPLYHFDQFYKYLDIIRVIITESSLFHISSVRTRTRNLWFLIANR